MCKKYNYIFVLLCKYLDIFLIIIISIQSIILTGAPIHFG